MWRGCTPISSALWLAERSGPILRMRKSTQTLKVWAKPSGVRWRRYQYETGPLPGVTSIAGQFLEWGRAEVLRAQRTMLGDRMGRRRLANLTG
jgi:hypothetical protein